MDRDETLEAQSDALLEAACGFGAKSGIYTAKQMMQRSMRELTLRRRMEARARRISPEMDRQYMLMHCWQVLVTYRREAGVTDRDWEAVQAYRACRSYETCEAKLGLPHSTVHKRVHRAIDRLVAYFGADEPMSAQIRWLLVEVFGAWMVRNYRDVA